MITNLSPLGVGLSLSRAVVKLRFYFHAIRDKVCQFPATGGQFPPGTPVPPPIKLTVMKLPIWCTPGVESDVKPHQTNNKQKQIGS